MLDKLMILSLFLFIATGYPVAFALAGTAVLFAGIAVMTGAFDPVFYGLLPQRIFGIMSNPILLAIPFFICMGAVLEKTKLAEDLLSTMGRLMGDVKGGLALSVVIVGAFLGAATGVVGASVVAMGMISLPVMMQCGYDKRLACGVIVASGTLGQIIPPSIVLVVLADQMGVSVGKLFQSALLPGVILSFAYCVYVVVISKINPRRAPALKKTSSNPCSELSVKVLSRVLLPPSALVFIVLGSMFAGLVTPTEAGAMGAIGAVIITLFMNRMTWRRFKESLDDTVRTSSMIIFLLIGATAFTLVFRGLGGDVWIRDALGDLPGGAVTLLLVTAISIFILGFFIDFFEIVFIVVPLLVPVAQSLGVDLVWFGVYIAMLLQTSFLTPPFGFALFYLRGVSPRDILTGDIYKGTIPFLCIQLLCVLFLGIYTYHQ